MPSASAPIAASVTPPTVTPGPGSGLGHPLIPVVLPITPPPHGCAIRGSAGIVDWLTGSATCAFVSQTGLQSLPRTARAQNQPPRVPRKAEPNAPISQPPGTGR